MRPTQNVSAILWDLDGTLADTAELHFQAWAALSAQLRQPFSRADFAATFGLRNPEIIPQLFGSHYSAQEVADLGLRKEELYRDSARKEGIALAPGAHALLQSLHAAGFPQAIGSSAPRDNLELILRLTHIEPFFKATVSMEDTRRGKPDPEVFQTAAARLGVAPQQCLVMEDAPAGVQAAKSADMICIAVLNDGHHSAATLRNAGADLVVKTLEEVSVETVRRMLEQEKTWPRLQGSGPWE